MFSIGYARIIVLLALALSLSACSGLTGWIDSFGSRTKTKFSPQEYGVSASPRMGFGTNLKKGGGRYKVGSAYKVRGKWYHPREQPGYDKTGVASWYGPSFHGRLTANGEIFDQNMLSAAHPTLPLPSYVRVTNLSNGQSTLVRVNDRGPFAHNRIIDLSSKAASVLRIKHHGTAKVRVQYVGRAPLNGDDTRFLLASINSPTGLEHGRTRLASVDTRQLTNIPFSTGLTEATAPRPPLRQRLSELRSFYSANNGDSMLASSYAARSALIDSDSNAALDAAARLGQQTPHGSVQEVLSGAPDNFFEPVLIRVYTSGEAARQVAMEFALLGRVAIKHATVGEKTQYQVFIDGLRPGVSRDDINNLAAALGVHDFLL